MYAVLYISDEMVERPFAEAFRHASVLDVFEEREEAAKTADFQNRLDDGNTYFVTYDRYYQGY